MGSPFVLSDFVSTLYRFHEDIDHRTAFPRAVYVHPRALDEIVECTPEHLVTRDPVTICGVRVLTDDSLADDEVLFVVPAHLMRRVIGVSSSPVLHTKPEYANNDRLKGATWKPS